VRGIVVGQFQFTSDSCSWGMNPLETQTELLRFVLRKKAGSQPSSHREMKTRKAHLNE